MAYECIQESHVMGKGIALCIVLTHTGEAVPYGPLPLCLVGWLRPTIPASRAVFRCLNVGSVIAQWM